CHLPSAIDLLATDHWPLATIKSHWPLLTVGDLEMICSISSPPIRRRPGDGRGPRGFTLVELLVVILILAVLITLLLPALNFAVSTAKNAAVGGEINQLAQALASFKAKYGDYPPSRIYLSEDGNLQPNVTNLYGPVNGNAGDITYAQLGQRSIAAMRKFFPR